MYRSASAQIFALNLTGFSGAWNLVFGACSSLFACLIRSRPRNLSAFTGLKEVCAMGTDTPAAQQPSLLRRVLIGRHPKRTLVRMTLLLATSVVGAKFVFLPIQVQGESMLPTYQNNRWNFVN